MNEQAPRNDRGHILIWTVAALAMIFVAVLATARAFQARLDASLRETLAAEQRAAGDIAEAVLDAWMADPALADQIINPPDPNNRPGRDWVSPLGENPCPEHNADPPRTVCWRIRADDPATPADEDGVTDVAFTDPDLRGGEAQRVAKDVTIEIAAGCYTDNPADCQQISTITRRYEQAVTFQYQLHYDTNAVPPAALYGPDGVPNDPTVCNVNPNDPACDDLDPTTVIVFTSEDTLNGPLRYSGDGPVLYCGSPTFRRIEAKNDTPPEAVAGCNSGTTPDWEALGTVSAPTWSSGLDDVDRFTHEGELELPPLPPLSSTRACTLTRVNYHVNHEKAGAQLQREANGDCPPEPVPPMHQAIRDGDLITSDSTLTIDRLVLNGSVTIYAKDDIIICGNVEAKDSPSGGTNVIALITEGDVVLDPRGPDTHACSSVIPSALDVSHDLSLINVAVLAPKGAIYAQNWHLGHAPPPAEGPTLTIEGSIAAKHLGLYGIPDPATGTVTAGWNKEFTYPDNFWLARPSWWPGFSGSEWEPVDEVGSSDGIITPELVVSADTVTVGEGSTATLDVRLATPPSAAVTVSVISADSTAATVTPSTLTFLATNWYINQPVTIEGVDDADLNDESTTITLTGSNGGYDNLTETVTVEVTDQPPPTVSISDTSSVEGSPLEFTLTLSRTHTLAVTVTWVTGDMSDTAYGFVDYNPGNPPQPVTITAGSTTAIISVPTIDNTDFEPDKTMTITLQRASGGATLGTSTAQGTITEDDSRFTAADATAYVAARDGLISDTTNPGSAAYFYRPSRRALYNSNYTTNADYHRGEHSLDADIPLGEDNDPYSLADPSTATGADDLRDAIDALAVAAGLPQSMIDAAESG